MSNTVTTANGLSIPLASILSANDESLARLRGVPALALEWLPGLPIAVYHITNSYGVHPDGALLENVAVKYHLREQLANGGADYVIHGVVVGPDIQGNPLGLTEYTLYGLDVYDASEQHWLDWNILIVGLKHLGIEPVPDVRTWWTFQTPLDKLKILASRQYNTGQLSRGLLLRPLRHEQHDPFYVSVENPEKGV